MSIAERIGGGVSTHRKVPNDRGVKAIAIFKLVKGTLLLALATGALALLHSDLTNVAMQWVDALQVDPDNKYVQRLLETVMSVDELAKKFSVTKVVVIGINVLVVCYLIARLGGNGIKRPARIDSVRLPS